MMNKEQLIEYRDKVIAELKQDKAGLERVKLTVKQKEQNIKLLDKQISEMEKQ